MSKLTLCIGIHNHQPYGNFDHVMKDSLARCYMPFIETIEKHPSVKWNVHFSGPLLLWLKEHEPDYLKKIRRLIEKGRAEILGSGISEAILCSIPPSDVARQIKLMNALTNELFGATPRGIWLTERIWEPALPSVLAPLGVEYVAVDDYHFFYSGMKRRNLEGYFAADKHGFTTKIFPISEALRYRVPFKEVKEFIAELKEWAKELEGEPLNLIKKDSGIGHVLTYLDDGEKFGVWPGTFEWVYEKKWLEKFLTAVEENSDWLNTALLSEVADAKISNGRVALPTTSYREMMEWALPPEATIEQEELYRELGERGFAKIKGGFWDEFLTKYEESNRMHKYMQFLSKEINVLLEDKKNSKKVGEADFAMLMGQCNDAYWHGLFGGLYLPFLRGAVYDRLIEADRLLPWNKPSAVKNVDFNCDGNRSDAIVCASSHTAVFSGREGGCLYLWCDLEERVSYTDVLTRRMEAYHRKVKDAEKEAEEGEKPASIHDIVASKEKGLDKYLVIDKWTRLPFRAFVAKKGLKAEDFRSQAFDALGALHNTPMNLDECEADGETINVCFTAGSVALTEGASADVGKYFAVAADKTEIGFGFWLENANLEQGAELDDKSVYIEYDFTLNALDDYRGISIDGGEKTPLNAEIDATASSIKIIDEYRGVALDVWLSEPTRCAAHPIETVSVSEAGFERNYQGTALYFEISLPRLLEGVEFALRVSKSRL